ncbi:hypothetical protein [Streptomyces sp. NPDC005859]
MSARPGTAPEARATVASTETDPVALAAMRREVDAASPSISPDDRL